MMEANPNSMDKRESNPWHDSTTFAEDSRNFDFEFERCLAVLSNELNSYHNVRLSEERWKVFIGPWLGTCISVYQNRSRIRPAENKLGNDWKFTVPVDFKHFVDLCRSSVWNEAVQSLLFGPVAGRPAIEITQAGMSPNKLPWHLTGWWLALSRLNPRKPLIESTYFSGEIEFALRRRFRKSIIPKIQTACRDWLKEPAPLDSGWRLESLDFTRVTILAFLRLCIPTSYLENFSQLKTSVLKRRGNQRPFYLTSNSYWYDEWFKLASALRQGNSKLIIGQHGGVFGSASVSNSEKLQLDIADHFLSWGWSSGLHEGDIVPVGNFGRGRRGLKSLPSGGLAVVMTNVPQHTSHQFSSPNGTEAWREYSNHSMSFVESLTLAIRNHSHIRLKGADFGHDQINYWHSRFPFLKLDTGRKPLKSILNSARVVIVTYNGTTHLDTLNANFPTVLLWDASFWQLRPEVAEDHDLLRASGLLFHDPVEAARHIARVWDDLDSWWESPEVQNAVDVFCKSQSDRGLNSKRGRTGFLKQVSQLVSN